MEEMKETLDETVLELFQVLEEIYQKQAKLELVMKDGFFSMARARYNLGVKRVTADQIVDADLTASRTVQVKDDVDKDDDSIKDVTQNFQDLFIVHQEKSSSKDKSEDSKMDGDSGIRQRGKGVFSLDKDDKIDTMEEEKKFKLSNPINLFGVLLPQTLKDCQKSFEEAVSLSVDIANQKCKLGFLRKRLEHLKQEKKEISSEDAS